MDTCVVKIARRYHEKTQWREHKKKSHRLIVLFACLFFSLAINPQNNENVKSTTKMQALPPDLEMQLALSALPPHLRENASVYILNPALGFELARKGTNG
jgi:hypothetical protein